MLISWYVKESLVKKELDKLRDIDELKNINKSFFDIGWGNGYVSLPKDHIWYGINFNKLNNLLNFNDFYIRHEITYSEYSDETKNYWVIGFDTAHYGDNSINCSKKNVEIETIKLYKYCMSKYYLTYRKHKLKNILKDI